MLTITCYGAVKEIGGNKILLEDSGSAIILDFGKSFSAEGSFFDEFLQPRTNSCLRDLLRLGLLPGIPGIYRHDLLRHAAVWGAISDSGLPTSARRLFESDIESYEEYTSKLGPRSHGGLFVPRGTPITVSTFATLTDEYRCIALPKEISTWSLTSMKERVIKVGARLVMHARRLVFQMAEVSLTRGMLARILERIRQLEPGPG